MHAGIAVALLLALIGTPDRAASPRDLSAWLRSEIRHDRYRYHFDNPSSFDTAELVPHYFEQSYRADNTWLVAGARYPLLGVSGETEFGLSLERGTIGDDYDTFFQPDGNVVVYGTTADVSLRSMRVSQHVVGAARGGFRLRAGYAYQRDRAVFAASYSTTTQTKPPSFSSFWNTGRETTISQVHEVQIGAEWSARNIRGWSFGARADAAPVRLARLTTILPDKYPGRDILFQSKGVSLTSRLSAGWSGRRFDILASVGHYATWNYRRSAAFHRDVVAAGIEVRVDLR